MLKMTSCRYGTNKIVV